MARAKPMSSVDHAWLRMDASTNLMMITGVLVFETPMDIDLLRERMRETILQYPPFRSRVVREPARAWWQEDESFDLNSHLHRVSLPGKADKQELEAFVADLTSQRLDMTKPLWQFHLVENYLGGQALVARIHHCIGDGIALVSVMLSMTEGEVAPQVTERNARMRARAAAAQEEPENPWDEMLRPFTRKAVNALNSAGNFTEKYLSLLSAPERFTDIGKIVNRFAKDAAALAMMPNDSRTRLKGKPGVAKAVAWNEPIPLTEVKAVGKAMGCSINDVLMACAAGAVRSYLLSCGDAVADDTDVRAMIPVNLRRPGDEWKLGNQFGLVPLTLPVGIEHPLLRVLEVRERMNALKGSAQAHLATWVLGLVGGMPKPVQKEVLDVLARKATAVMTNVPGPQTQLTLAGGRLKQILFWVPQSGDIGIGVSILSYNGGVQIGVIADKKLCPNPQEICDRFAPEFEKLAMGLLLNPWWPEVVAHMAADAKAVKEAKSAPQVLTPESAPPPAAVKPKFKKRSPFAAARNG